MNSIAQLVMYNFNEKVLNMDEYSFYESGDSLHLCFNLLKLFFKEKAYINSNNKFTII